MRLSPAFVFLVGAIYTVLAEGLARTAWRPLRGDIAVAWAVMAATVFAISTGFIARRAGPQWAVPTIANAAAAAGLGSAVALLLVAWRVQWGRACNQCQPGLLLTVGTACAIGAAALAAFPTGAVVRRLVTGDESKSRPPAS